MTLEAVVTELRLLREEVGKICADVGSVKEIMVEMMEGKKLQRKKDADRKKTKRERDAEERLQGKITLPDNCPVDVRDKRLEDNFLLWAHAGMEFGRDNDVRSFFTYLTLAWNQTVYHEKVITRSGNRPHVWRGNVRHRSAESWSTIFGTMTGRVTDMVLSDLSGQLWFAWGFAVFYPVWEEMKTLPGFDDLPDRSCRRACWSRVGTARTVSTRMPTSTSTRTTASRTCGRCGGSCPLCGTRGAPAGRAWRSRPTTTGRCRLTTCSGRPGTPTR